MLLVAVEVIGCTSTFMIYLLMYLDVDWTQGDIELPVTLCSMISNNIPMVRVDCYDESLDI